MREQQVHDSGIEAPIRPAIYGEPLLGDAAFLEPEQALQLFCLQLKSQFEINPFWQAGTFKAECVNAAMREDGFQAMFQVVDTLEKVSLDVGLSDGWICATIGFEGFNYRFFIERVYEDWEVWPPKSSFSGDSPGSISAKMHWAQFDLSALHPQPLETEGAILTIEAVSSVWL